MQAINHFKNFCGIVLFYKKVPAPQADLYLIDGSKPEHS